MTTKTMLSFILAFAFVMLGMPSLIQLALQKNLLDEPSEDRKVHKRSVPRLGGVLVFIATLFTTCLLVHPEGPNAISFLRLAAGSLILFFLGLKDDLTELNPIKKLWAQIAVGCILILGGGFAITDFEDLFGWGALSWWFSPLFSLFVYIVVVNAVNLIDGIDTLAGGYGLLIAIACTLWFEVTGQSDFAILCLALAGSLTAFLVFNITPARIFLGDSGSLILGMFIYVMATSIMQTPIEQVPDIWSHRSLPVLAMTTLSYPLVDTLRVFTLRVLKGKSPFTADRNHLHHRLLRLGMTHVQAALSIHGYTAVMVSLGFGLPKMEPTLAFFVLLGCAFTLPVIIIAMERVQVLSRAIRRKENAKTH
ncbi:MAG: undecaprenyl/decaprenyl-phosphate alpha-N-acetylglucosaminyl 1-phosphate transferase [Flavobacteriales bacterium]|nr:undecaprenyl/decaprenyl-phosphate alpha-N-acetylglucosaminyl 1-phosphate transferase [Flavobacteriales bacterium]